MSIFVSYKREDSGYVEPIVTALRDFGFRVWYDPDLSAGNLWMEEVNRRLHAARAVVVCWSQRALQSDSVLGEAKIAHDRGVIVPVALAPGLALPPPFNAVQTEPLAGWDGDRQHPGWLRFVGRITQKVDVGASLSDAVATARRAYERDIDGVISQLKEVSDTEELPAYSERFDAIHAHLHGELFQLFVVGRMKTGKSTLINALLGKTDRPVSGAAAKGPLPVDDLPCTAVLTRLRYSDQPYVRAIPKDTTAPPEPWTFEEYHTRARIRTADGKKNDALFDRIREFHVGWPAELLRNGVTLVDSPGVSEKPERTELTRQAIRDADAAVVVYRSEPLAGEDEIRFAGEVTTYAGKAYTLINRRDGREVDAGLENEIREKLGIEEQSTLEQAGIYPVDLARAVTARYRDDERGVADSGLLALERRLARFLISERYHAHVGKVLGDLERDSARLALHIEDSRVALTADAGKLAQALEECRLDLEEVARRRKRIDEILGDAQEQAKVVAIRSFQDAVADAVTHLPADARERSIPGLAGLLGSLDAATIHGKRYLQRTVDMLNEIIQERFRRWGEGPPDQPGLQRDLFPVFERLDKNLRYEAGEIDQKLLMIQRRLSDLDPRVSTDSADRSILEHMMAHSIGFALFGPLGAAIALGGLRGVAGGLIGKLLGTVVAKAIVVVAATVLHFVVTPAMVVGIILAAAAGGSLTAVVATIEDRLKRKALEEVLPQLQAIAEDREELGRIEAGVASWFQEARERVGVVLGDLLAKERQSLDRLQALSASQKDRARKLEELDRHGQSVATARARIHDLTDRLERVG